MIRQPAVAGQFYTGDGRKLRAELETLVPAAAVKEKVLGIVAPHAGYMYSGAVAGEVYGRIEIPPAVIVLGPNHHGLGARAALYPDGEWLTPLGNVPINARLAGTGRQTRSSRRGRQYRPPLRAFPRSPGPVSPVHASRCHHSPPLSRVRRFCELQFAREGNCAGGQGVW